MLMLTRPGRVCVFHIDSLTESLKQQPVSSIFMSMFQSVKAEEAGSKVTCPKCVIISEEAGI